MKKPLNKMNKADLYELAKQNRDLDKSNKMNMTLLSAELAEVRSRLQASQESMRILRAEKEIDKKMIRRYHAQKQLIEQETGVIIDLPKEAVIKKGGFLCNLFRCFS